MIDDVRRTATYLVDEYLGRRLDSAGDAPGLREATTALIMSALQTDDFERLIRQQLEHLRHPSSTALPDAYLAGEAAAEDALQHVVAGARAAMARAGHIVDAPYFERGAFRRLHDDSRLAVRAELARVPRPLTRPRQLRWSLTPAPWATDQRDDSLWPPPGLDETIDLHRLPGGAAALARVESGPRTGWVQIGLIERHSTPARRYPDRPDRHMLIAVGLQAVDGDFPTTSLPFTSLPWQFWTVPWQRVDETMNAEKAAALLSTGDWAMVALSRERPRIAGLGEPPFLLIPALPLVVALGLEPTREVRGFSLSDQQGSGLVGRLWRSHLVHDGSYQPLFPAVEGADLLLRADLFARLCTVIDGPRAQVGVSISCHSGDDDDTDDVE